jgi:hypothetical protein
MNNLAKISQKEKKRNGTRLVKIIIFAQEN